MIATLRQRNFALLWFGGLVSLIGDWILVTALPFYVYQQTHSTLASGTMLIVSIIPGLLFGSVAGVFVDRWDRRRTMIVANLLRAGLLLLLLAVQSAETIWIIYVVSFMQSAIAQFFGPAENALLPQLVGKPHLPSAYSLNTLNDNAARLIGPTLGGVLAATFGLAGIVLADVASFVIATGLIALISMPSTQAAAELEDGETTAAKVEARWSDVWREWRDGLAFIGGTKPLRQVFLVAALAMFADSIVSTLFAPFVNDILKSDARGFGWLLAIRGVGGLVGGVLVAQLMSTRIHSGVLLAFSLSMIGVLNLLLYNFASLQLTLILMLPVGIVAVGWLVSQQTLIQMSAMDRYRGRVFGAFGTTSALLMLIGSGVSGVLGDRVGVMTPLYLSAGLYVLAGMLAGWMFHRTSFAHTVPVEGQSKTKL